MHPNHRTWRIRGLPRDVNRDRLARAIRYHSDLKWPDSDEVDNFDEGGTHVTIYTLAPDLRASHQVATVRFTKFPTQLQNLGAREELTFKIDISPENGTVTGRCEPESEVTIDEHFDGITTLFSPVTDEDHQIDILAVSGLGSHSFGSFVNKNDGNMWLANNLPQDIPAARVMIFGYESKLHKSRSHIELDDLAGPVHIAISQILQSRRRPLLLIGHSLGGLLLKDALIRSIEPGFETGLPNPLNMISGMMLFGTPNDGLDIESLVPMVGDQPNRSLLESLRSTGSQMLSRQRKDFSKVLEHTNLELFCLYETELSPTATQDPATGDWKMGGPLRVLVSKSSATSCLPAGAPLTRRVSIRRNHSDLVKFSCHDAEYDLNVAYILKHMQENSTSKRTQECEFEVAQGVREPRIGNSAPDSQRLPGGTQSQRLVKRPADDIPSTSLGKRPRLASHLPGSRQAQDDDAPAAYDQQLADENSKGKEEEMRKVKEELIGQLYFSKIDERLTHLAPAQANTCRWFLTESKYQSWKDVARTSEHGGFLWIKGNPGTGKSTLMKHLFEQTKIDSRGDSSRITLSFFFLARGAVEEKTTTGLFRSLLHQLFEIAPDLKAGLEWMTIDGARTIQRNGWSEETLKQTLKHAVPKLGSRSLTVFVDALDECDENKAGDMVSFFEELCDCAEEARVKLQICFSSRYYPTVVINKGLEVYLEDEHGHAEDIRKYIKSRLRLKSKNKNIEALRSEIQEKSKGIFLWVVLVLEILNKENSMSIHALREHLKGIPPGLDELFQMIICRDGDNLEQLQLCLNWILFAHRALKPQELYFAIQLCSDKERSGFWDENDLDVEDMKTFVRSCSKGLAEVTRNKASEVQFIHESVRDFLLGTYRTHWSGTSESLEGHGHRVLRDCCLAQLKASISQQIPIPDPLPTASQTEMLRKAIASKFPFLRYSVDNVLYHSNLSQRSRIEQGQFLSDFPLQRWISLNNILEQFEVRRFTNSVSLLYIFAEKDLGDLIRSNPGRKLCFQIEAERCGAPILAALAANNHEAVREFLRAQAENELLDSPLQKLCEQYEEHRNGFGRTYTLRPRTAMQVLRDLIGKDEESVALAFVLSPHSHDEVLNWSETSCSEVLSLAIQKGHETVFRVLLEKLTRQSGLLNRLLLTAIDQGHMGIIELLLNMGADINLQNSLGQTPLWVATQTRHSTVVKMLLDKGANVDLETLSSGPRPLLWAATCNGHAAIVKMILDKGADVEYKDPYGGTTLLSRAASNGHADIVKILLDKGADVESKGANGVTTPLSNAASNGHTDIVKMLLDKGADVEFKGADGVTTPLSNAASNGNAAIVKMLLDKGAPFDSKSDCRSPLLFHAINWGHVAVLKELVEKGLDIESRDQDGMTLLSFAVTKQRFAVVKFLVEQRAVIDSGDHGGQTPLIKAVKHGVESEIIELLLKAGADIEKRDNNGCFPLYWAARTSYLGDSLRVARILVERNAYIESRDGAGRTPLFWAAARSLIGVAKLLLEKGAGINSRDNDGRTPLSWAAENSDIRIDMVKLLLEKGADPKSKDKAGRTPLSWALMGANSINRASVVTLLQEAGGDRDSEGSGEGRLQMLQPTSDID